MDARHIHITGGQAISLMRAARKGDVFVAEPSHMDYTPGQAISISELTSLGLGPLLQWLGVSANDPLRLRVPQEGGRHALDQVVVSSLSQPLHGNALLELHTGNDEQLRVIIPETVRVFVDAPSLALVWASESLAGRMRMSAAGNLEGTLRLIDLASECCGSYARDAANPRTEACHFDEPKHERPFAHLDDLRADLEEMRGTPGLKLARKVAGYAIDGSGSPMETYLNLALTLPPRLAGVSMTRPIANQQLVVDDRLRSIIDHESLRPDLQWPEYNTLAEFMGDECHASKSARTEDKNRLKDYVKAEYAPIFLMFDDVRNASALNQTILTIARELMRHGKRGELYRVRRIVSDEEFLARQRILVKTLLPPLTRYDARS